MSIIPYGANGANGRTMPAETKPEPLTWLDLPRRPDTANGELVTRQEVVARAREAGVTVDDGDLVFWERRGILPRPMRRYHAGAPRAMYPPHAVDAVITLRTLQELGVSLNDIAELIRTWVRDPGYSAETTVAAALVHRALIRLALWHEQALGLPPGTLCGATVTFTDAAGDDRVDHPFSWAADEPVAENEAKRH